MEPSINSSYDPYQHLPFRAYRSAEWPAGEVCSTLMHFIAAEKFRGADESYRRFLLSLSDPDDLRLETEAIGQGIGRDDWNNVQFHVVRAGVWMQLVQHQERLREALFQPGFSSGDALLDEAISAIYSRLVAASNPGDELRRVILAGDTSLSTDEMFRIFDQLFQNRLPDEIYVSVEDGVAAAAQRYAISRYIPVNTFGSVDDVQAAAAAMLEKGTHVFTISTQEVSDSPLANALLSGASAQAKPCHRFSWTA